ncbi:hypothetical protein [Reichenbachiella sp. 5M10]|uniref:hypothetical protein n=1 Tax=Reichenbachiella sp. 5M10 TaxID=1889772 RepID=UPI0013046805|nr:hypothetical protein [Reichenbachiella sp. 5M10]
MNLPALEQEIVKRLHHLDVAQQADIMQYINSMVSRPNHEESYRKKAIREIRTALKSI